MFAGRPPQRMRPTGLWGTIEGKTVSLRYGSMYRLWHKEEKSPKCSPTHQPFPPTPPSPVFSSMYYTISLSLIHLLSILTNNAMVWGMWMLNIHVCRARKAGKGNFSSVLSCIIFPSLLLDILLIGGLQHRLWMRLHKARLGVMGEKTSSRFSIPVRPRTQGREGG